MHSGVGIDAPSHSLVCFDYVASFFHTSQFLCGFAWVVPVILMTFVLLVMSSLLWSFQSSLYIVLCWVG